MLSILRGELVVGKYEMVILKRGDNGENIQMVFNTEENCGRNIEGFKNRGEIVVGILQWSANSVEIVVEILKKVLLRRGNCAGNIEMMLM